MKSIGIAKIKTNNPILDSYKKTIKSWNPEQEFVITENYFYGVFLNDKFLGASTMDFNPETSCVNISIINGCDQNYNIFQQESARQLTELALEEYDAKDVNISYVKKLGNYK